MCAETDRADGAVEIVATQSLQGVGIDAMRQVIFLESIEAPSMEHGTRVARAHVHTFDARVIRISVAIAAEQTPLRSSLEFVALGVYPATHVIHMTVLEPE